MNSEQKGPNSEQANLGAAAPIRGKCDFCEILRESIPAVIALAIVVVALWMLLDVHHLRPDADHLSYQRKKDVLLLTLGFLGTVTGYYFGRVPAERHADAARDAARSAQERERNVRGTVHTELAHIRQKHNETSGAKPTDDVNTAIDRLHSRL